MIERAEWRRRAGGPTTALGLVFGADGWRGISTWLLVLGVSILWGIVTTLLAIKGALVGVPFTLAIFGLRWRGPNRWVAPEPLPEGTYPVGMKLKRGWRTLGEDVGTMAFIEGWLVFEGEETDFSVARKDVLKADIHSILLSDGTRLSLDPTLGMRPMTLFSGPRVGPAVMEMKAWLMQPTGEGLSRLPPKDAQASRVYAAAGLCELAALHFFGQGLGFALSSLVQDHALRNPLAIFTALAAISVVPAVAAQVLLAWTGRKERRLSREPAG